MGGGSGQRFGRPKQYELVGDERIIDRSRRIAATVSDGVVVVVPAADAEQEAAVAGGITRSESVRAGLAEVPDDCDVICIHDAARPLASRQSGAAPSSWWTSAKRSPPMPHMCWVVTASTALVAMAASAAFPPRRSTSIPAFDARLSTEHTMPLVARRVWNGTSGAMAPDRIRSDRARERTHWSAMGDTARFLDEVRGVVGPAHVLTEVDVLAGYTTDWTGRFVGSTPAVVRPAHVDALLAQRPRADSGKRGVVGEAEERHDIRGTGHVFAARGARASERAAAEAARRVA